MRFQDSIFPVTYYLLHQQSLPSGQEGKEELHEFKEAVRHPGWFEGQPVTPQPSAVPHLHSELRSWGSSS